MRRCKSPHGKDDLMERAAGLCEQTGKIRWPSPKLAVEAANRTNATHLNHYRCKECGAWHVGHRQTFGKRNRRLVVKTKPQAAVKRARTVGQMSVEDESYLALPGSFLVTFTAPSTVVLEVRGYPHSVLVKSGLLLLKAVAHRRTLGRFSVFGDGCRFDAAPGQGLRIRTGMADVTMPEDVLPRLEKDLRDLLD